MAEQHKRGSLPDHGKHVQSSSKKPRAQALVKQNRLGGGRRGEGGLEEEEVGQSGDAWAVVASTEVMHVPQLNNLSMGLTLMGISLLRCRACLLPLKPPTFKCVAGHILCGACRARHAQACAVATAYAACAEVDAFVRDAKVPCVFAGHGCASYVAYYQAADRERACPWAPCYCPDFACHFFTSPARLLDHFRADHPSWPVTSVAYGEAMKLTLPPPPGQGLIIVLVSGEDRSVFLVSSSALGRTTAVSVVCVRANGDAAAGVSQFSCEIFLQPPRDNRNLASLSLTFPMPSSDMWAGVFTAAEQDYLLAMTPKMMATDASGEAPDLMIRIDKAGQADANSTPTPAARSSEETTAACNSVLDGWEEAGFSSAVDLLHV
ncbi:unnamed protein product [Urochloa decumbens]|uniref:SIAH-type domain-containing protein n=1 Tax=Urochloa decumbens TaxID=240449 RepID=A0ABC8YVV8_9POAL